MHKQLIFTPPINCTAVTARAENQFFAFKNILFASPDRGKEDIFYWPTSQIFTAQTALRTTSQLQ